MNALYIALSIPVFFLLIGVELWVTRRRGIRAYRFADSITNLSCGVGQQVLGVFLKGALLIGYVLVYEHLRVMDVAPTRVWGWIALMLLVDFAYYWFHRISHRMSFVWATHAVHHQSEEYNLSVALRQSALQGLWTSPFYLPIALLGFPPLMFVAAKTLNTLYQFWIHTRVIGKLGPLELFLNTPSHHRVHHAINPKYIDKNYGGILIVWDRLFGTFVEEADEPVYGTVKPLRSWNPLWANLEPWVHIASVARRTRSFRDRVAVWLAPPEWRPRDLGGPVVIPEVTRERQQLYHTRVSASVQWYVMVSFAIVSIGTAFMLVPASELSPATTIVVATSIGLASIAWGGLFERRRWAVPLEAVRWLASIVALIYIV